MGVSELITCALIRSYNSSSHNPPGRPQSVCGKALEGNGSVGGVTTEVIIALSLSINLYQTQGGWGGGVMYGKGSCYARLGFFCGIGFFLV